MVTVEVAARFCMGLPHVAEGARFGNQTWFVRGKSFAWLRPFTKADIKRFGAVTPPSGPILAVRVASLEHKEIVLMTRPVAFFTMAHFNGYPAVLIQLDSVRRRDMEEAIVDAWVACAPPELARSLAARFVNPGPRPRRPMDDAQAGSHG